MAFTVGQAIDAGRAEARKDPKQLRYPDEKLFMKARCLPSRNSEINLIRYMALKSQWVAAGR